MICPKCKQERGCACTFHEVPNQVNEDGTPYKICKYCYEETKLEILKNDPTTRIVQANTVPILQRDQQGSEDKEVRDQNVQS